MKKDIGQIHIGILGGGQLGRMLIQAGLDLNLTIHILDPDPEAPCRHLCASFTCGSLQDEELVFAWGKDKDLITIEIEHVSIAALKRLKAAGVSVFPEPEALEIIQDKREQKQFFQKHAIPTAPFVLIESLAELNNHPFPFPFVQKSGKGGYDGKGVKIHRNEADLAKGLKGPGLVEACIPFEKELAVIAARNTLGEIQTFPVVEMVFHPEHNLVEFLAAPANISAELADKAAAIAKQCIDAFGITGILAVEMFLTKEGAILVNEVAPRPHNSGHHTIEANYTSQYQQHWRAILGLPLGDTRALKPAAMLNLLGAAGYEGPAICQGLERCLEESGVYVHLYGKKITKPFRKMGHVTVLAENLESALVKAKYIKDTLTIIS